MSPVERWAMPYFSWMRLACVPLPYAGGPKRTTIMSATRTLEASLLDQAFVLVREQVAVHLSDRVHGHRHDDQERCAAEQKQVAAVLRQDEFRHQADQHQVDRADRGQ